MRGRIALRQAVIVEGKYDKIKLEALVDGLILTTEGFRIFKDPEMRELLKRLAHGPGIVILTDSDAAGFKIRKYVSDLAAGGDVTQVYIPDVLGKERRKPRPGKEGKLGVEGIDAETLRESLFRAGLLGKDARPADPITRQDLYEAGLSGGENSRALRRALLARLGLPARLSSSAMVPVLGVLVTREQFLELVEEVRGLVETLECGDS